MTNPVEIAPDRRAALDTLVRAEWPKLRRYFETKVPVADAHDLVQATFLAYAEAGEDPRASRAFLWGIARNKVRQFYDRPRVGTPFDSLKHTAHEASRSLASRLDERNRLIAALQKLPIDHQTAFELHCGEELSLEDVAKAIGVSLATTKRYIAAAKETLRESLGTDPDECADAYRRA